MLETERKGTGIVVEVWVGSLSALSLTHTHNVHITNNVLFEQTNIGIDRTTQKKLFIPLFSVCPTL